MARTGEGGGGAGRTKKEEEVDIRVTKEAVGLGGDTLELDDLGKLFIRTSVSSSVQWA